MPGTGANEIAIDHARLVDVRRAALLRIRGRIWPRWSPCAPELRQPRDRKLMLSCHDAGSAKIGKEIGLLARRGYQARVGVSS
jgi:hypothetical protein